MPEITPGTILYNRRVIALARQLLSDQTMSRCVFFLGSGMGVAPEGTPQLPTGKGLSELLARDSDLDFPKPVPLPTLAFYYEFYNTRAALNDFLIEKLTDPHIPISPATSRLVDLVVLLEQLDKQPVLVITTNYDQHFEKAYRVATGRDPLVVIYNGGRDAADDRVPLHTGVPVEKIKGWHPGTTCLYKIHGCISNPGDGGRNRNLVITEDDYINFLSNCLSPDETGKGILPYVRERLSESPVIFVGYSLSDWNMRVIFKTTTERLLRDCCAVQKPDKADEMYWDALVSFWSNRKVSIINHTGADFLADLHKAVQEQSRGAAVAVAR